MGRKKLARQNWTRGDTEKHGDTPAFEAYNYSEMVCTSSKIKIELSQRQRINLIQTSKQFWTSFKEYCKVETIDNFNPNT